MPMLTMLRMRLPVWPLQRPERTAIGERAHAAEHHCTSRTTLTPSTMSDSSAGMRSATCSTGRFSETLMTLAAKHGVDALAQRRSRRPAAVEVASSRR